MNGKLKVSPRLKYHYPLKKLNRQMCW